VGCRPLGFPEIWIDFLVFYASSIFFRMDRLKQRAAMAPMNYRLTHFLSVAAESGCTDSIWADVTGIQTHACSSGGASPSAWSGIVSSPTCPSYTLVPVESRLARKPLQVTALGLHFLETSGVGKRPREIAGTPHDHG
jgi:hypothetical protein